MTVSAVVGAQWGDEGKGRVVDYMAQRADMVIRFQGGDNAGHTVVNGHGTFKLHLVPSGVFNPETRCVIGTGCVVNPEGLLAELAQVAAAGVSTANLWVSERAQVVLPHHLRLDVLEEEARSGAEQLGTTKRGIGPAYAAKAARRGVRMGDLRRPAYLRRRLEEVVAHANRALETFGDPPVELEALWRQCVAWGEALGPRIIDTLPMVQEAYRGGAAIVLEGQLGVMRDLDWGTYPYVTSSHPTASYGPVGAGLPPTAVSRVVGVVKAYSTAVGAGPFVTELHDADGARLRDVGCEYGATTGRPRRCGWFDAVAMQHAAWLGGFTELAVTKLDVLDGFAELKVCTAYVLDGEQTTRFPDTPDLERARPVYETWPGWGCSTKEARTWEALPEAARAYVARLSALSGAPCRYVSVGPERDQLVVVPEDVWKGGGAA